jgi:hypothetical protein
MKHTAIVFVCMIWLFGAANSVQVLAQETPMPAPEVQKLASWLGTWKAEDRGYSGTTTCDWHAGGFGLVCRMEGTSPEGKYNSISICSYDPDTKEYSIYTLSSDGPGSLARGTLTGNTWLFQSDSTANGKRVKNRSTFVDDTPMTQSYKVEISLDGGPWDVVAEGKSTKVK